MPIYTVNDSSTKLSGIIMKRRDMYGRKLESECIILWIYYLVYLNEKKIDIKR